MTNNRKTIALAAYALAAIAAPAAAHAPSFEEQRAHEEEALILTAPIAGIENKFWFNYQVDVLETKKELRSDLRHASDSEDLRDAWDEYRIELSDTRHSYVKEMHERGYRQLKVTVGG